MRNYVEKGRSAKRSSVKSKKVFRLPLSVFSLFFYLCRLVRNVNNKTKFYVKRI